MTDDERRTPVDRSATPLSFFVRTTPPAPPDEEPDASPNPAGEARIAALISVVLRTGVAVSAVLVLVGAIVFLSRHGDSLPLYHSFRGSPRRFRELGGIVSSALAWRGRGLIQFGLLILLATPVARVALSFVGFAAIRDRTYVAISGIVLALLALGFTGLL